MIKIAVVGSRGFDSYPFFAEKLEAIISKLKGEIEFVSGGCPSGADNMIAIYCKNNGFKITEYLPDWTIGKHAGFLRNKLIVDDCTHLIAFWDEKSKGTKNSIDMAQKQNKPIRIIKI